MKVSQNTEALPVLLTNFLQSREQKWFRASIVSSPTSRTTEIATSAWEPKFQGLLAENALVPSCQERKFGVIFTADHKVLSERCESRHNHRHAVVVQDLATQWIQSYPRKTNNSQETEKSLQKFLEPTRKPKVIHTDNFPEFGKSCEELSGNHCTSSPRRSETNAIADRAVRRIKEGTSAVLLQSGLDEKW